MNFYPILKKELKSYFVSPIAYIVITIFLVISGYFFYSSFAFYNLLSMQAASSPYGLHGLNITEGVLRPLFLNLSVVMLLLIPVLTMRLFAEEKKLGTIELLLSYPVRDGEVLLGKFGACLLVFILMLALTGLYLIFLILYAQPEYGPIFSCYLGLFLMGTSFISLGVLASSLTENQIIAAVATFGALLLFWAIGWASHFAGPSLGRIFSHLSIIEHFDNFTKGVIESKDVLFYIDSSILCLFLTMRSLESKRWRG
jgi:ABC-2 type transport system permease protein